MKKIRTLIVGIMLGGALGATMASEIVAASSLNNGWSAIEIGLIIGTSVGICLALLTSISTKDKENRQLIN